MSSSQPRIEMNGKEVEEPTDANAAGSDGAESDSDFGSELIRITISDDSFTTKTYHVHKSLICKKSPYFAALKNFNEGPKNDVSLQGIDHGAFRQVLNWVYVGVLRKDRLHDTRTLIGVCVIADRLMMGKCADMAMDELRAELKTMTMELSDVRFINDLKLPAGEVLVQFVLDQYVYDCIDEDTDQTFSPSELHDLRKDIVEEITSKMHEIARDLRQYSKTNDEGYIPISPANLTGCMYHTHRHDEKCYLDD